MEEISQELLDILVCPKCRTPVTQDGTHLQCQNADCGLRYPIRDGIPIMLIDSAEPAKAGEAR
jgi:uncharacterized protein YbaR (Trm112 family)